MSFDMDWLKETLEKVVQEHGDKSNDQAYDEARGCVYTHRETGAHCLVGQILEQHAGVKLPEPWSKRNQAAIGTWLIMEPDMKELFDVRVQGALSNLQAAADQTRSYDGESPRRAFWEDVVAEWEREMDWTP